MNKAFLLLSAFVPLGLCAQFSLTPVNQPSMQTVTVEVPSAFSSSFPSGKTLRLPVGYKARIFYAGGLNKPRFMTFGPNGVLFVADMAGGNGGRVLAFPDANQDGIADTMIIVASGFTNNHDVKFYNDYMYVTETVRVYQCADTDQDGIYETKNVFIDSIGGSETDGHITRTIVFDSTNNKLYLSIGSSCNVCRESHRAIIEQYNDDGTGKRTFATGTRNAVGMTLHPVTNRLWANNNGSDRQGNEIPPEWIDIVRDGGFYGHPFAYANQIWFNFDAHADYVSLKPITATDSARVETMIPPAALIRAHSAPMAIEFLNSSFPTAYQKGFLTALRGSWNTTSPNAFRGYKVIYGHLSSDADSTVDYIFDFAEGFLTDSINQVYWGRPVGLALNNTGNVFVSSDEGNKFILQIYKDPGTGFELTPGQLKYVMMYPNPASASFTLAFDLQEAGDVKAELFDLAGRKVTDLFNKTLIEGEHKEMISVTGLPAGIYLLKLNSVDGVSYHKLYLGN